MRILRATMFPPGGQDPVSTVIREIDTVDLNDAAKLQAELPGAFVICDIFELPGNPNIIQATVKAMELQEAAAERESHMALTYYFEAFHLERVQPGGVLTMTQPAPLTVDDLEIPLRQLVNHPSYDRHTIIAIAHDGTIVELRDGEIHKGESIG